MADGADAEDKTEAATALRLERARAEGRVAVSREACMLAAMAACIATLIVAWPIEGATMLLSLRAVLARSGDIAVLGDASAHGGGDGAIAILRALARPVGVFVLPVMGAAAIGGIAASLLQSGVVLHLKGMSPDLSRIDPRRGIRRLVSPNNLFEQGKAMAKLGAYGVVTWNLVGGSIHEVAGSMSRPLETLAPVLTQLLLRAVLSLLAVQAVIAGADILWVRTSRARSLRMTRVELRDEQKETDGDPKVKGRLRMLRRRRARQRMMQAIPTASVVLTNPTHYAVALAYTKGSKSAPKVVAKGADEVAARIRAAAREHGVPLVANPPLARALFAVPLDHEVPAEHFRAVAAVIAYVWQLAQRRAAPV